MKRTNYCYLFITAFFAYILPMGVNAQDTFTYPVGQFEVTLLSEGQREGHTSILLDAEPEMVKRYAPNGTFPNATNAFLVRTPDKLILIDAGYGTKLFDNLQQAGVAPEQINVVLITHMHGDHIGGLLRNGAVAFPNAEIYLPKPEYNYWNSKKEMNNAPQSRLKNFEQAQKVIAAYKKKLHTFQPAKLPAKPAALFPGFEAIAAYGHTPGHTMYLISSGTDKLLVWGDLTHAMAIQMPRPEIAVSYDINPAQAIVSRKEVLDYVTQNSIPVAGMHIAFPGIGNVFDFAGGGYVFRNAIDREAVKKAVVQQMKAYPESRLIDIYKNFFQDYFGPGHLIADTAAASAYLHKEMDSYNAVSGPVAEPTGWQGNFYRVNLSVLKEHKIPYPVFFDAFVESANHAELPTSEEWLCEWKEILKTINEMQLNLPDYDEDRMEILELILSGGYAAHHSEAFNAKYQPHYRLIAKAIFDKKIKPYLNK